MDRARLIQVICEELWRQRNEEAGALHLRSRGEDEITANTMAIDGDVRIDQLAEAILQAWSANHSAPV